MASHPPPDEARLTGALLDGKLRVEEVIGGGAMGTLYVASDQAGRRCAVKVFLGDAYDTSNEAVRRFEQEGRVAASIDSANVARVLSSGADPGSGVLYIAMELLDGEDVDRLVASGGPLEPAAAVRIATQAARGLAAAHAAGLVHRDVKPANLFLHREAIAGGGEAGAGDRRVTVKVCDFGIAKVAVGTDAAALTRTGSRLGSPLYMSPEQVRSSKHVDKRSDLWGLGMCLWTMLAGRPALEDAPTLAGLFLAICTKPIPWLQESAPWVDPSLARIVHGLLTTSPAARCPSADALIEALRPFTGGTDEITLADLAGLAPASRDRPAHRGAASTSWVEIVAASDATLPADSVQPDPELFRLVGTTLRGTYALDRLIGAGGMGAVYEATSRSGERFAVKILLHDHERPKAGTLSRFLREAKATTEIDSPHVVRVVDATTDEERGLPFIVMELLDGADLDHLVKQHGAMEPGPVVKAFMQACRGIGAAHARSIVHRDVKPANIFLHRADDGTVTVKICDFGIAKRVAVDELDRTSTDLTQTGGMLGSPAYMSPEQARSAKTVDRATDVWSLGVALYEALSGQKPWHAAATVGDLVIAICTEDVPPLQDAAPWIDPGLAAAVHRALQRDPAARYASMDAFAEALAPYAEPSEALYAWSLAPVSVEVRAFSAPRMAFGVTTQQPVSAPHPSNVSVASPSRAPLFVGVAIGLAGLCAMAYSASSLRDRPAAPATVTSREGAAVAPVSARREDPQPVLREASTSDAALANGGAADAATERDARGVPASSSARAIQAPAASARSSRPTTPDRPPPSATSPPTALPARLE